MRSSRHREFWFPPLAALRSCLCVVAVSGSSRAQPPPAPPPLWTPAASSPEFLPSCFLSSLLHDFTGPIVPVQPWTPAPGSLPRASRSCGGDGEWERGPANGNAENEEDGEQEADSVVGEEEEEVGEERRRKVMMRKRVAMKMRSLRQLWAKQQLKIMGMLTLTQKRGRWMRMTRQRKRRS